ncbi:hypothetical protein D9M71_709930 [compost metagenome]
MNRYTITGVRARVLSSTRGTRSSAVNQWPNTRLKASETGKNASQMATACFQRGGFCTLLVPNQSSIPLTRASLGRSNRPLPRCNHARREAECSQACRVGSSLKRKMI